MVLKKITKTKCKKGEILRKGSVKKAHSRKTSSGKKVSVKQSRMPATCIKDVGSEGKGPKILPPLGDEVHLSNFGYSLKETKQERQKSLKKASKKHGTLKVLKRTNLIANYSQWNEDNYKKLRQDVEFLKDEYAKQKEMSRTKISKKKAPKKNTKKGSKKGSRK
jgi:hypothetical protein